MTLAFEDFHPDQQFRFGGYQVTATEIIEFARQFDPQPFHLDEIAAKNSLLGGLAASGWHTCAMNMRMLVDHHLKDARGAGAPGIEEVRWLKPVRPGMVLNTRLTVRGVRVLQSRPEIGLVTMASEVSDQNGLVVMTQRYTNLFERRDKSAPIPPPAGEPATRPVLPPDPPVLTEAEANQTRFASHYEDVLVGARLPLGSHTFTRAEMIDFATRYDPQAFHLDDAAAAATHFGKLSASGWHTASVYMGCYVRTRDKVRDERIARGLPFVPNGPSPGFRNLGWFRPVFIGDTLSFETTVVGKRPSSRAGYGIVMSRSAGYNQDHVKVFESYGATMTPMRRAV